MARAHAPYAPGRPCSRSARGLRDEHAGSLRSSGLALGRRQVLHLLPPRRGRRQAPRGGHPPVRAQDPRREPAPDGERSLGAGGGHHGPRDRRSRGRAEPRDRLHAEPRAPARLHGRARGGRPRRHAHRDEAPGRRPEEDQPAPARRAGDRPLGPGRRVRRARLLRHQRPARVPAQPRALPVPQVGAERAARVPRRPARHRHLPPGEPRVPRARRHDEPGRRHALPRHARRRGLAHRS